MAGHKFKVGEAVLFRPKRRQIDGPLSRAYRITQQLPARGNFQYQIRCTVTEDEFAASESELFLMGPPRPTR